MRFRRSLALSSLPALVVASTFAMTLARPSPAAAQTAIQIPLQFDLVNPGAKSLALGGAFAGLADDATAAFANPAGLRELGRRELSVEVRGRWLETLFLQRGRLSGQVSNELNDVIAGPVFGEIGDSHIRVPYLSVVLPRPQQGWVVAGFRHEMVRVNQVSFAEGVFQKDPAEFTSRREIPQEVIRKIAIDNYGVAGAIEINRRLAVGGTLSAYTISLHSLVRRVDADGFLGPPLPNVELSRATQDGDDIAFGPSLGLRVCLKPCDERQTTSARFGAVYRYGPGFDYETQEGPRQQSNRFRVPHVVAGGVAVEIPQSGRRLLLTGEVKRIGYSRLKDDFITDQAVATGVQDKVDLKDGIELHAGFQYTAETLSWLPRFRAGIWSDPDHSVGFIPGPVGNHPELRLKDELLSVALSTGKRLIHYTAGIGVTFSPTIEWNVGADFASHTGIISTSMIVKLGQ
jgi:long-subunit fatty acid transport protein